MLVLLLACSPAEPPARTVALPAVTVAAVMAPPAAEPVWPEAGAPLIVPVPPPAPSRPVHLVVDAGHGSVGNLGNTNVRCEKEADVTRRIQDAVVARLTGKPGVEVRAGRPAGLLSYDDRIAAFEAWPADFVVSLHTDTRQGAGWALDPATGCWAGRGAPGFTVLYSDEGARVAPRRQLARAVATRMAEAGFLAYDGADYAGLYAADATPGVFVDRHAPAKRIKMLRRPRVPVVLVETHQAVDPDEVARWDEPGTLDAFAAAIYAAAIDAGG